MDRKKGTKTILHITECLGSGVLNYIRNLCSWQSKEYKIIIAYSIRPETPDNFIELFDTTIQFIRVEGFTREISPINDMRAFLHIKRIVRDYNPDLIHLHSSKAGVIGRWAINCKKYKVIYSPHAYSFLMMDCSRIQRTVYRLIESLSDRKQCITIADAYGELVASKGVASNAICIPNGIDPDEINRMVIRKKDAKENRKDIIVSILGKVVPQKNPELFNQIAHRLSDYKFIWIGAGELEGVLDSNNITITGWVPREKAVLYIDNSDVFVFTSKWESLSIALMEAMALGKPCVVSKCHGNVDVIKDGINGFLCDEVDEYVETIKKLVNDKELAKKIGKKAREEIYLNHNIKLIENKYRELFHEIGLDS